MAAKNKHAAPTSTRGDAVALLRADHKHVDALFKAFEGEKAGSRKKADLVKDICHELTLHMRAEEEIFYPAVRKAIKDAPLMNEADVEHDTCKQLISELEGMKPDDNFYDAKVTVLSEYIRHHVKEEHAEMFPKARDSGIDLQGLGQQIKEYKTRHADGNVGLLKQVLAHMPLMPV